MAFADAPVRDVEYRDLYGLSGTNIALANTGESGAWKTTVTRFAPIYLKFRGYNIRWDARPDDPDFVATATRFRESTLVNGHAMTESEFEAHVSSTLAATLAVAGVVTYFMVRKHRHGKLNETALMLRAVDGVAWNNARRRRRRSH